MDRKYLRITDRPGSLAGWCAAGCLLLGLAGGCAESPVAERGYVVPVHGVLLYHGEPVGEAQLTFYREDDPGEPALAATDADGRFRCLTNDSSEGIRPGEYVISVSHSSREIPARYMDLQTSPLAAVIEDADDNELRLELVD